MTLRRVGVLVVLAVFASISSLAPASAATSPAAPGIVDIIGIPGLQWSDVAGMPTLDRLFHTGATGLLTVKTAGAETRCAAGLLAVSAGNRTSAPVTGCSIPAGSWSSLGASNRSSRFGATLGALGTLLGQHDIATLATSADAVPMVADEAGRSPLSPDVGPTAARGIVVGVVLDGLYDASTLHRPAARKAVDRQLATALSTSPGNTVMVVGLSDAATGQAHLHPLVISGPGWPNRELRGSTGRTPYVQLIDIAPTVLAMYGIKPGAGMVGQPIVATSSPVPAISAYLNADKHAVGQRTLGQRTFLAIGLAMILLMLLAWWGVPLARSSATWLARVLAPAPALAFLGNAVPWWRWGQPTYAGIVLALCVVVAVATGVVARRSPTAAVLVAPALSLVILVLDQLDHSRLQFSAPLGDNPLVAGRFHGVGNLDFAVIAVAAVLVGAFAGCSLPRPAGFAVAAVVLLVAVAVDGTPRLGDDLGGVLTLVPAALVVLAGVLRVRVTATRAVGGAIVAVLVAVGIALADYSRPASSQTHVGRFVGQVLHGGALTEVHRKFDAMIGSFGLTIGTFVAGIALILAVINRERIRTAATRTPGLPTAALAAVVVAVLGAVLNDSGITVAAMVVIVGFASVYGSGRYAAAR